MGDILRPDFSLGGKRSPKDESKGTFGNNLTAENKVEDGIVQESVEAVAERERKSKELIRFLQLFADARTKKLASLNASPSALTQARAIVKGYSTEELLGWMEKSTENDWQTRAGFYQSIWAELRMRMKL
jgi:hypothetical protein